MTPQGSLLDALFQELQSEFDKTGPDVQAQMVLQIHEWAGRQMELSAIQKDGSQPKDNSDFGLQQILTLVENEVHLNQMAENIEQVIWMRDLRNGRILYVSPAFERVWGRTCSSFYANPLAMIESIHPEDRLQVMVASPNNNRQVINQEYRILRPDGDLRWILARVFLVQEKRGPSYRQICIAQDVTGQKQVELALRKALDRTQEQFTLSRKMSLARKPEAVLKVLMSARELRTAYRASLVFFDNPEGEPVHGIESIASWQASQNLPAWESLSVLYEEPALWELFHPNKPLVFTDIPNDPRMTSRVRSLLLDGKIISLAIFPLVALRKWIGCLLVFYNEEHHFDSIELRHLKVLVDQATITLYNLQLLEVEAELRHDAERANEIKTQFLAMISHELRTPLTSIIGFTTTLLAEDVAWEPDEQRDFFRTIRQEAYRLQELIDHLLDLSRLEAGMLPISPEPQSLQKIIEAILPELQALTAGQDIILRIPPNLPWVQVDAKRITQVLVNLIQNAAIYAPAKNGITISAAERRGNIQVDVSDQGPGIPPAERKKVFEAFRRGADEENRPGKGAGLGLAISKRLIEAHGGRIWIKSKTTPGATVSFIVPLAASPGMQNPTGKEE